MNLHGSKSGLAANVPQLDGDITFCYFSHVETNSWYHIFGELAGLEF
jgi:hypothetical protein